VSFAVSAEAYDRFMGRYSVPLAPRLADLAGVAEGDRALDVGCGPGALTAELVRRLGAASVTAVDPSESFVAACRERNPGVEVLQAAAEALPFPGGTFDVAAAQLVVHFMPEPVTGLRELARVLRPGGTVAACVWDHAGGQGPLSVFWTAARRLDPDVDDESRLPGTAAGQLGTLFAEAGLGDIHETVLAVDVEHATFDDWWEPFMLGVGPAGVYAAGLDAAALARLRDACRELIPDEPFVLDARAWAARGTSR
jgi:SAM-dependent methyltransferase